MKTLKRISILVLTLMLVACGGSNENTAATTYSASNDNEHAIEVDSEEVSYQNISVTKTGNGEGEDADFYGENAAIYATNGANLTIEDADISTDGEYANGVFAYGEGTTITISDSTINTSQRNSGGIMVTGGGSLYANNLTIQTEGGSSAAIRSDRGGGTMVVDGGTYTANGSGSPAIYSTANISVSNASLNSGSAQAVVVEGGNTVELNNCTVVANNTVSNSDKTAYLQAVMLYQSMSGDASDGEGSFKMIGGSLTSLNEGMFFVTNATYSIDLSDVDLSYASTDLLRIEAAGWGNEGSNGGQVTFNLDDQDIEGIITVDSVSKLNMYLSNDSEFEGSFANEGSVYVEIEEGSTWELTADCSITSLTCAADSIDLNGYTLTVNGEKYVEGESSSGEAIEFTISQNAGMPAMGEEGANGPMNDDGQTPPEMPEGGMQMDGDMPPEMPEGEMTNDGNNPPTKPDGEEMDGKQEPPEKKEN